jgi:hypothetical protein
MKFVKILIVVLMVLPFLVSCADLGAGGLETNYTDYFSSVILMSPDGKKTKNINDFYESMSLGESSTMYDVVDYDDYRLIAFEVANGYTLTVSEFAFFLHTEKKTADLTFSFYVVDELPDRVGKNKETETPDDSEQSPTDERTEEDVFEDLNSYHEAFISIGEKWDSVHLEFAQDQTVYAGQYIVVRITDNVCDCGEENPESAVPFTFNYLLFHISEVKTN